MKSLDGVLYYDAAYGEPQIKVAGSGDYCTYAYRKEDGTIGYAGPCFMRVAIRPEDQNEEQRKLLRGLET